jgi:rubrerythrin
MSLKGTKTKENLEAAFAGESQANRRYLYFAQKADLEYLEEVGDPATGLPIGETKANLASAVQGETHEYTDMYPGMAKTAREEGFEEIADWFETLAKAEKSHAGKFQKTLESIS